MYNRLAKRQGLSVDATLDPILSWLENTLKILFRAETAACFLEIVKSPITVAFLQCFSFYGTIL
jgi:hypothetical protein